MDQGTKFLVLRSCNISKLKSEEKKINMTYIKRMMQRNVDQQNLVPDFKLVSLVLIMRGNVERDHSVLHLIIRLEQQYD